MALVKQTPEDIIKRLLESIEDLRNRSEDIEVALALLDNSGISKANKVGINAILDQVKRDISTTITSSRMDLYKLKEFKEQKEQIDEMLSIAKRKTIPHFVSKSCIGEICKCGEDASHKVGEEFTSDMPNTYKHNLTAYVCCKCFTDIFGNLTPCNVREEEK